MSKTNLQNNQTGTGTRAQKLHYPAPAPPGDACPVRGVALEASHSFLVCLPSSVAKATRAAQIGQSRDDEYEGRAPAKASRAADKRNAAARAAVPAAAAPPTAAAAAPSASPVGNRSKSSLQTGQLEQVDAVVVVVFVVLVSAESPQQLWQMEQ